MSEHPIQGMMDTTMDKIRAMVDGNTIIGDPIHSPDGTVIIPVSKVTYGFAAGGSDFCAKGQPSKDLFGGGSGAGVTISPVAFLSIGNGETKLLQITSFEGPTDRVVGLVPEVIDKIASLFKKGDKKSKEPEQAKADDVNITINADVSLEDPKI